MKLLYFTASGNSLHVAKTIGGELISIPAMVKSETYEFTDEKIGIVFPIYSIKVQPFIEEFLMKAKFNCKYLFAVMTYGVFDGATVNHLMEIAKKANHNFSYVNTVSMVDTWLPGFKMESQKKKEPKKNIDQQLATILSDIETSKEMILKTNIFDRMMTNNQLRMASKPQKKVSMHGGVISSGIKSFVTVEDTCVGCGVCSRVCPVDNIIVLKEDKLVTFGDYCLSCFACTQNCPTNSIRLKGERSRERFRNANVSLAEIVAANK